MAIKWIEGEWAEGRFYILATLLILLQTSGYIASLPALLQVLLFADVYALLAVLSWRSMDRRGMGHVAFRLVSLGLIITALVSLWPTDLPLATPAMFDLLGIVDWQEALMVSASVAGAAGWGLRRFAAKPEALDANLLPESRTGHPVPVSS